MPRAFPAPDPPPDSDFIPPARIKWGKMGEKRGENGVCTGGGGCCSQQSRWLEPGESQPGSSPFQSRVSSPKGPHPAPKRGGGRLQSVLRSGCQRSGWLRQRHGVAPRKKKAFFLPFQPIPLLAAVSLLHENGAECGHPANPGQLAPPGRRPRDRTVTAKSLLFTPKIKTNPTQSKKTEIKITADERGAEPGAAGRPRRGRGREISRVAPDSAGCLAVWWLGLFFPPTCSGRKVTAGGEHGSRLAAGSRKKNSYIK